LDDIDRLGVRRGRDQLARRNQQRASCRNGLRPDYLTTDQGKDWTESDSGVGANIINALYCVGSDIFAGTNNGVFLSRDDGSSWAAVDSGLTDTYICSLYANGPYLYAGTFMDGVWRRPIAEILTGVKGGNKGVPASFRSARTTRILSTRRQSSAMNFRRTLT